MNSETTHSVSEAARPTPSKPARPSQGMPFIMPDGRPLSAFLQESNLLEERRRNKKHKRPKEPKGGWNTSSYVASSRKTRELTDIERAELQALEKVGQRRQRRWLNDKILRDMNGPITAKDMESLFKPVPFGDTGHVSVFTEAAAPEFSPLIDLFRTVDADRQARVLKKWEEHVEELRREGGLGKKHHSDTTIEIDHATAALTAWMQLGNKTKRALRKAPRGCIEELEHEIVEYIIELTTTADTTAETTTPKEVVADLVLELEDGFQRLLAHGLAQYHGLRSFTKETAQDRKVLVVRQQQQQQRVAVKQITCCDVIAVLEERCDEDHVLDVDVLRCAYIQHENYDSRAELLQLDLNDSKSDA